MPAARLFLDIAPGDPASELLLATALRVTKPADTLFLGTRTQELTEPVVDAVVQACARLAAGRPLPTLNLLDAHEVTQAADEPWIRPGTSPAAAADAVLAVLRAAARGAAGAGQELLRARNAAISTRDAARRPGQRPLIVIVAQVQATWGAVAEVVANLAERADADVEIVAVPSEHENRATDTAGFIGQLGYPPRDLDWLSRQLNDVGGPLSAVFFYDPWDGLRPEPAQAVTVAQAGVRIAYIPYGTNVGGGSDGESYAYDLPMHRLASRIYARSETQRQMFAEFCSSGADHVRVLGVPKFDRSMLRASTEPAGTPTVLWNPHFSVEPDGWSTFLTYAERFLTYAAEHEDLTLILRPHFRILRDASVVGGDYERFVHSVLDTARALPNMQVDEEPDYMQSFAASHAMVSDLSSLIPEYLATGKPVLYLHRSESHGVNRDAQYLFEGPLALDWPAVEDFLERVRTGQDHDGPRRRLVLERHFAHLDGKSAQRIASDIVDMIKETP
ncbi:CDP-glycerol glycerophosphotransferase family protein [Mobilicoccus pelagius]|uniref:Uncharacterized protein n=1 Tax=Mobilicoccus pelagius NBRC 104925 TaxID=1089455 RepID=H5UQW4_9MICO|nr:CDP-glycerol glycerophosphotransferase family protein [Mobilicoccus pelagius]GAB48122.1 hypothetical protein MOPEL_060_00390 [Mobilicoccus pelagius NBRC 104925]